MVYGTRREFLRAMALGTACAGASGGALAVSPRAARAQAVPLRVFSMQEARTLEAFGEVLVPGAGDAGIVHFVDHHCAVPGRECLLMSRYLDVAPPFGEFYRAGLRALDRLCMESKRTMFAALARDDQEDVVNRLKQDGPRPWPDDIPAFKFYLAVRADAVDVVHGTVEGFERLGLEYMPHILPAEPW